MITMLLVEDESFERTSLATCVEWELIGIEIIAEAANGSQGLVKVLECKPDIVLTDVKMPGMDGIEMSRRIRKAAPDVKIIFLSSYDDFEYAQKAIDLSISAYLMKPVNETDLLRVVKKVADEINEKKLERRLFSKEQDHLSRNINLARQAVISRALSGVRVQESDTRNLGLDWLIAPKQQFLIVLCTYEPGALSPIDAEMERLTRWVSKIYIHSVNVCVSAGQIVVLCGIGAENAQQSAQRIGHVLRDFFEARDADVRTTLITGGDVAAMYTALLKKKVRAPYKAAAVRKHQNKEQIAREIERIINERYKSPLTLESISRELHFTPNYAGALFKSVTNMSVNQCLLRVRVDRAKQMLAEKTSLPLSKIAEACGFFSVTYFHTMFKRATGMTPNEYRQRIEKDDS